jgi:hypothetical protein
MGPLATLAVPAIGAGIEGFFNWISSRSQSKAATRAAQIRADSARQTGRWAQQTAKDQLEFQKDEAKRLGEEFYFAQKANWDLDRQRELGLFNRAGDLDYNRFGLERWQARIGSNEAMANRINARAELNAGIRREYGRFAPQQRRIGRIAELTGTPQPLGGREIGPIEFPGALYHPDLVDLPDPRQRAFSYPEYEHPPTA